MMTMREKICVALVRHEMEKNGLPLRADVGWDHPAVIQSAVEVYADQVDVVLTALREPDEGALQMLRDMIENDDGPVVAWGDYGEAFTAMIDHIRSGK